MWKTDGTVSTGIFVSERGAEEIYADAKGNLIYIDHSDIDIRNPSPNSIMPAGLAEQLTDKELRHRLPFLKLMSVVRNRIPPVKTQTLPGKSGRSRKLHVESASVRLPKATNATNHLDDEHVANYSRTLEAASLPFRVRALPFGFSA